MMTNMTLLFSEDRKACKNWSQNKNGLQKSAMDL
jgi:hypothetical protein